MIGKLEKKILGTILIVVVCGSAGALAIVDYLQRQNIYETSSRDLHVTAEAVTEAIGTAMLTGGKHVASEIATNLGRVHDLNEITVLGREGNAAFSESANVIEPDLVERFDTRADTITRVAQDELILLAPLENAEPCRRCHMDDGPILGAVRLSADLSWHNARARALSIFNISCTALAALVLALILWLLVRRIVIKPVKGIERAARRMADGDLRFDLAVHDRDEIGTAAGALQRSVRATSDIIGRVQTIARRVGEVARGIDGDSREVLAGTEQEAEALAEISSSIREMRVASSNIATSADGLAATSAESASAVEQMDASIVSMARSSSELFREVEVSSQSIGQILPSVADVTRRSADLLSATESTLDTLLLVTRAITDIEQRTRDSAELSLQVRRAATRDGLESMAHAMEGMRRIEESVRQAAEQIARLEERSSAIGNILVVIDEVTARTKLLALNASILAARVGGDGKGFGVVAQEIRDLAQRTSHSTHEIEELIAAVQAEVAAAASGMKQSIGHVSDGLKLTTEAQSVLERIAGRAEGSAETADLIQRATSELADAAVVVQSSMVSTRDFVEEIADAMARQSNEVAQLERATERVRTVAAAVRNAAGEQQDQSRLIKRGTVVVHNGSQQIARAVRDQEQAVTLVDGSVASIAELPSRNREISLRVTSALDRLLIEIRDILAEMETFVVDRDSADR